ncbi:MAG: RNase P subunit p30 family protein, partial [Candidatus Heimdallarchaeota archaeon]
MTPYFEPRVKIKEKTDSKLFEKIAKRLQLEGYVILGEKYKKSEKESLVEPLQKITRVEIKESKVEKIRSLLPKVRNQYELVSVKTSSAKAAQWVVKDNRVDILTIPYKSIKEIITQNLANVAANSQTFLEIDISFLTTSNSFSHSIQMRVLSRVMNLIIREKAPFILTMNVENPLEFREERSIIAMANLVGIPNKAIKENMRKFKERIELNRNKLSPDFITPGVWKVEKK